VNHVVITGAAGAIGAALARAFRRRHPSATLTLVDRDRVGLARVAAPLDARTHTLDLADLSALPSAVAAISAHAPIDALINCAGVMWVRDPAETSWRDAHELLTIDLLSPLRLQSLVVPSMIERRTGLVVNIASMAGKVPLHGALYYGAAKAGLAMASEIARADLARHGIEVVTVYPGPVHSALERTARAQYHDGDRGFARFVPTGDPDVLASKIIAAIAFNKPRVIYPAPYALGWFATNLAARITLRFGPHPNAGGDLHATRNRPSGPAIAPTARDRI
jgi:short-subunit dehydrogenase